MLTDTHAHLDFPEFAADFDAMLSRASASVHPGNAADAPEDIITPLRTLARHPRVVAIGECGLDYHRLPSSRMHEAAVATQALGNETPANLGGVIADGAERDRQAAIFTQQLDLAVELGLNVVIHERDAWDDTLRILGRVAGQLRAVFHCFGKGPDYARQVLDIGHIISFTGIVTFKNAGPVKETATSIPAGRFMLETDGPYLAPVPYRGKRCEPAHVRSTAETVAALRGVPLESLAAETEATANGFFRFPT